jgi:hypothetical protein
MAQRSRTHPEGPRVWVVQVEDSTGSSDMDINSISITDITNKQTTKQRKRNSVSLARHHETTYIGHVRTPSFFAYILCASFTLVDRNLNTHQRVPLVHPGVQHYDGYLLCVLTPSSWMFSYSQADSRTPHTPRPLLCFRPGNEHNDIRIKSIQFVRSDGASGVCGIDGCRAGSAQRGHLVLS